MDATIGKAFHVSPFLGMDSEYRIRMTTPGEQLRVHMESHRDGRVDFDATLAAPAARAVGLAGAPPAVHDARASRRASTRRRRG